MMKDYRLFIDELGSPNPKSKVHPIYILMGCSVPHESRTDLKAYADQIKFKYWGHTNIVFHSKDIGNNNGDYSIFRNNPVLKKIFYKGPMFIS